MHTKKIVDPFNGLKDLKEGRIKATNKKTFVQDPLRVLRIMQLLPRKGKFVDKRTIKLCKSMVNSFDELPKERVFEEFNKLLLKAKKPSMGLNFLKESNWIKHFPELSDLIGCPQNLKWHPEGDVWDHTCMVLDNAALLRENLPKKLRLSYMYGALLHDIGKPATTDPVKLTAHGHDEAGVKLAENFMLRLTNEKKLISNVCKIVKYHMRPGQLTFSKSKINAWKRLHNGLRLDLLGYMSKADSAGRTGRNVLTDTHNPSELLCFKYFKIFGVDKIKPLIMGRDLIKIGLKPSPLFKKLLKSAYNMQLDGMNKEEILNHLK